MRSALLMTLSLLCLAAPGRLLAQSIPSPFRYVEETQAVGLFAAHLWTWEAEVDVGPQNIPLVGAQYAIRFTGPLSGLVSVSGGQTTRTVYTAAGTGTGNTGPLNLVALGESDFFLLLGEAGLLFHLTGPRTWNGIAPYGSLTVGGVVDLGDDSPLDEAVTQDERVDFGPGFAVGVSAGTEWFPTERISLRLDARDYIWRVRVPGGLRAERVEGTEWLNNLGISLGVAYHF